MKKFRSPREFIKTAKYVEIQCSLANMETFRVRISKKDALALAKRFALRLGWENENDFGYIGGFHWPDGAIYATLFMNTMPRRKTDD